MRKLIAICVICVIFVFCATVNSDSSAATKERAETNRDKLSLEEIRQLRKKAAYRKRRVIFPYVGIAAESKMMGEDRFLPTEQVKSPFTVGTQVNSYHYDMVRNWNCCIGYRSTVGQVITKTGGGVVNRDIETYYGDGPDGLDLYIDFCRKTNAEAFWGMRMNDSHDADDRPACRRMFEANKFKTSHPDFLVGTRESNPLNGRWSSVDYAHAEVREQVFRLSEEICRNYDVDGLTLDFFRHLTFFKSTAFGGEASAEEVAIMTELLRRIRKMADENGARRGRPILLVVRTPDSFRYCKALGLDIEQWMKEGLIDAWIASGYFRVQEWRETVEMASKHDVPIWASLDESRIKSRKKRSSAEVYRARAMNALRAGVDSIFLFNYVWNDAEHVQLLNQIGDIKTLEHTNKIYYADPRGRQLGSRWLEKGERFFTYQRLFSPENPSILKQNRSQKVSLLIGDDVSSAKAHGFSVKLTLAVQIKGLTRNCDILVKLNDTLLTDYVSEGNESDQWLHYKVSPEVVQLGNNGVEFSLAKACEAGPRLFDMNLEISYEPIKQ